MKKTILICLCALVLFGCDSRTNKDKIIGVWEKLETEDSQSSKITYTKEGEGFDAHIDIERDIVTNTSFKYSFLDDNMIVHSGVLVELYDKDNKKLKEKSYGAKTFTFKILQLTDGELNLQLQNGKYKHDYLYKKAE